MSTHAEELVSIPVVTVEEMKILLRRYGCIVFSSNVWNDSADHLEVTFELRQRVVRFVVPMPHYREGLLDWSDGERRFNKPLYDKAVRQRWWKLLNTIKTKLQSVDDGVESFDSAFMAQIVLPGHKRTMEHWAGPQIALAYERGYTPSLLSLRD